MLEIIKASVHNHPVIDVMVPTHDRLDMTMRCINSIYSSTRMPFHCIVVDDSTDGITPNYFRELVTKGVKPLNKITNLTFIHSDEPYKEGNQFFNIALRHMKSEYMATVMNSMRLEPDWELMPVESIFPNNPEIGLIGCKCLFEDNGRIESAGIKMYKYLPTDMGRDAPAHRMLGVYDCDAVQWAFAIVRRKAALGNLQEGVFHGFKGWDDIDNSFSVKAKGWRIVTCGMSIGYHAPRATRGANTEEAARQNSENGERFYKRWGLWNTFIADHPGYKTGESLAAPVGDTIHAPPKGMEHFITA